MNQMIVSLLNTLGLKSDPQTSVVFRNTVDAITQPRIDAIAPVPFSASVCVELIVDGLVEGMSNMLDAVEEFPVSVFGDPSNLQGFVLYIDTQRGSYWGDITVAIKASEILDVEVVKPTIDQTECNSLVVTRLNDTPLADSTITVEVVISGGGHSITRTLTVNVIADPAATINSITSAEGDLLAWNADIVEAYGNESDELFLEVLVDESWVTVDTYTLLGGGPQTDTISQTSDSGYAAGTYRLKVYDSVGSPVYSKKSFVVE